MADRDENDWFLPKRYGIGVGPPIAWQGWALLGGYIVLVAAAGLALLPRNHLAWIAVMIALTLAMLAITAQHTRGGWRWRWGDPD